MFNMLKILFFAAALLVLVPVNGSAGKFPNKDTAESRKDIVMGVTSGKGSISVEQGDDADGLVIHRPEKEEQSNQDYGPIFVTPEVEVPVTK